MSVDLHEKTNRVHARASLANEGKVHLGYIYANDPTLRTARQMIEGSWSFSTILRDWLEQDLDESFRSGPFYYLVHRDSLLTPETLDATYRRITGLNREMAACHGASYFGLDGAGPPRLLSTVERERHFGPDVVAAYHTPEIAVDCEVIGEALRRRVTNDPRITLRLGSEVLAAVPQAGGVRVTARQDGQTETICYDQVINASWEDLLHIDATACLPAPEGASFRLRYIVRVRAPHGGRGLRCASVVLGAFGDLVEYHSGDLFLSWYPVGRRGMVTALRPPAHWSRDSRAEDIAEVRMPMFAALRGLIPALDSVTEESVAAATVHAGIIYARGTTDIHDPGSGFHRRDAIGPRSIGNYHSVDTGKYITAPLFARRLAKQIAGEGC
jgi:hypothetical protein